jgi:hypothetical protein
MKTCSSALIFSISMRHYNGDSSKDLFQSGGEIFVTHGKNHWLRCEKLFKKIATLLFQ